MVISWKTEVGHVNFRVNIRSPCMPHRRLCTKREASLVDFAHLTLPSISTVGFPSRIRRPVDVSGILDYDFPIPIGGHIEGHSPSTKVVSEVLSSDFDHGRSTVASSMEANDVNVPFVWAHPNVSFSHQTESERQILIEVPHRGFQLIGSLLQNEMNSLEVSEVPHVCGHIRALANVRTVLLVNPNVAPAKFTGGFP
jgi:hypothetical protein